MASSTYFIRALLRLVRSPWSVNTRTMASATLVASAGFTITPVSRAKSLCPVMPPSARRNQTPGCCAEAVLHLDRLEADVVGVLQHRDGAGAVEGDVELARQAVERALVEDVEVPFARVGPGVDQLLRVDAGGRRAGDVADVVGARAARAKAEVLDRFQQGDRVLRLDLADLQIGARGDVRIAAAVALGEIGQARQLPVLEDAVRHAQPAHVGVLRRRDIEQPVVFPAEGVGGLREFVARGLLLEPRIGVERVLLALDLLLLVELAAGGDGAVLRER